MIYTEGPVVVGEETIVQRLAIAEGAIEVQGVGTYAHTPEGTNILDADHMLVKEDNEWHFVKTPKFLRNSTQILIGVFVMVPLVAFFAVYVGVLIHLAAYGPILPEVADGICITVAACGVIYVIAVALLFYCQHVISNKQIRKEYFKS